MQVINWLALQPQPADLRTLHERLQAAVPLPRVCQLLVETILSSYPWSGRPDAVACYHPSDSYRQGQKIALLFPDINEAQQFIWYIAQVKQTKSVETPAQGHFQVVTLEVHGRQIQMAGEVPDASYPESDLSTYTPDDWARLTQWALETHQAALQATLRKLIENNQLRGQLLGQIFLPERASTISPEILDPSFAGLSTARPWIGPEEILQALPDLAMLEHEAALDLIRASLKAGPYRWLGAERWTTAELFRQFDRDVSRGLTNSQSRSKTSPWTRQDVQDLAGYGRKFLPDEARRVLKELERGETLPQTDRASRRHLVPANKPLRLPELSYLHVVQAYVPVANLLPAFGPDTQMIFLQFMDGAHQPFLLDQANGVLKALSPEKWRSKILGGGLPAGTSLWLEYEGNERYRIVPRDLPFKRMVPCKLAQLKDGHLRIEQTQISMKYEGRPSLFKASLRSEEVEALQAESSQSNLRLRDAMIYALQELCASDPDRRAHWRDLFNAVSLLRRCSPNSMASLLFTQPCFEPVGGGAFRYRSEPAVVTKKIHKRPDRLSQLWDGFLAQPVRPVPLASERTTLRVTREEDPAVAPRFNPDRRLPSFLSQPETEPERPVTALTFVVLDTELSEDRLDPFSNTPMETAMKMNEDGNLPADGSVHIPGDDGKVEETKRETLSEAPFEDARAEFSFFSPTLSLEPRPAWLDGPAQPRPVPAEEARRLIYRPRFPLRPLHKQPFYRRIFFYLRGWLTRTFRKRP